jgi:lysophospholipase L1-like esterase
VRRQTDLSVSQFLATTDGARATAENTALSNGSDTQFLGTGALTTPSGGSLLGRSEGGPNAILGRAIGTPDIAVLGIGDSIMDGDNDTNAANDGNAAGGWFLSGLYNVNGRTIPSGRAANSGLTAQTFVASSAKTLQFVKWYTHVVSEYGTNDIINGRTSAQILANLQTIWAALKSNGARYVIQTTILPRTTSTDSFVTAVNQTPRSGFATNATRTTLNNSINSNVGANGLDAVFDLLAVVQDPTLTDRWIATLGGGIAATGDGTHPDGVQGGQSPASAVMGSSWTTTAGTLR